MNFLFIFMISILITFTFSFIKSQFQTFKRRKPSKSTCLVRKSSTQARRNNTVSLPLANNGNRAFIGNFPQTLAMHRQILLNLNILEYQLAKMERLLAVKRENHRLKFKQQPIVEMPQGNDSGSNN